MPDKPELFDATPTTVCPACNLPVEHARKLTVKIPLSLIRDAKNISVDVEQGHLMVCAGCKNVFFAPEVTE